MSENKIENAMKIGIITQPLRTNYGGLLQAYALQTVLERMGHQVSILDVPYKKRLFLWKMPLVLAKRLILKYLLGRKLVVFAEFIYNKQIFTVSQYTRLFISKYLHRIEISNFNKLDNANFDALVVGSDQVWRPRYNDDIYKCFLDFAQSWRVKRLSYAASFGTDQWEFTLKQTMECARLASLFDVITVREDSGVKLCSDYLGVSASHVLDPTLLLDREDYDRLVSAISIQKSVGNMMSYVLDSSPEVTALVQKVAKQKHLILFNAISRVEDLSAPMGERIQLPVEQWLRGFQDASFVITDSFHACVFSIIYNIPFVVLGNFKRGQSRFHSLLKQFGLEDRLVSSVEEVMGVKEINWQSVNKRKRELKDVSKNILCQMLSSI
ncbi:polysaccharide pyruvyl transferase family protein [Bacteroides fragilis]|uniref:polysaccharide pyruvyl transferase family protein n=1 Tax=Bacteroides fragilis TaxID=817 RepID=UPI00202DE144|nr:polysaccharide pyruvyl transferase family protein [Bacteroides fragilis]